MFECLNLILSGFWEWLGTLLILGVVAYSLKGMFRITIIHGDNSGNVTKTKSKVKS